MIAYSLDELQKIDNFPNKITPVDADEFAIVDSESSFGLKKLTWVNLKTTVNGTDTFDAGLINIMYEG